MNETRPWHGSLQQGIWLNFVDVDGKKIAIFAHLLQLIAILS